MNLSLREGATRLWLAFGLLIFGVDAYAFAAGSGFVWITLGCLGAALYLTVTGLRRACPVYALFGRASGPKRDSALENSFFPENKKETTKERDLTWT